MSFDDESLKSIRTPLNIVEIEFDNPLTTTGEYHCDGAVPLGMTMYPTIESIDWGPVRATPAEGIGYRGVVRITFQDFNYKNDPAKFNGTYFGRLLGMNEYWLDRKIKINVGFLNQGAFDWSNFQERLYFLKKIDGPDERGKISFTCVDIISKLDADQAVVPRDSQGVLAQNINNSEVSVINITSNAGFQNINYGYILIEDEVIQTSLMAVGSTSVDMFARGVFNTVAASHDIGETVRSCYAFIAENVVDVIYKLIDEYTEIDADTYIDLSEWNLERDDYLSGEDVTGIITDSTPVKNIIAELCEQCFISIWWDDAAQLIKLKAIGPSLSATKSINTDQHILREGHSISRDATKAITQVWVYYNRINFLEKPTEGKNYKDLFVRIDPDLESATGYNTPKIKKIFGKYIVNSSTASKISSRLINQKQFGDFQIRFRTDAKDHSIEVGDAIDITTDLLQGAEGNPVSSNYLIIEKERDENSVYSFVGVATGIETASRYGLIAPNTMPAYDSASGSQQDTFAWIASGEPPTVGAAEDAPYLIL